ncbi:hypothetical protein HW555_014214 [Spodoptera exigua]|uniref:DUF6570 domain-containing protein n=1 Tax=Spodoptera exigua TaxID=7107 RepID=A0A835KW86_SPOEX|nr:hypothetical protein HW555_014214 [Spodoptera exigua]
MLSTSQPRYIVHGDLIKLPSVVALAECKGDAKLDISCCHNPRNLSVVNLYDDGVQGGILDLSEEGFRFEIENCVALNVDRGAKRPDVLGVEEIVPRALDHNVTVVGLTEEDFLNLFPVVGPVLAEKANMGRPTKRASRMRQRRLNETSEDHEKRLSQSRKTTAKAILNENSEKREKRLSQMRTYMKKVLDSENPKRRTYRLGLIQDRLSNETEEQRTHRLSLISDRLSNETQKQRAHRLGLIHDRLNNETEEQRTRRLGSMQDRLANETETTCPSLISDRLSNETEEQRAHRLRLISDRLSNETEEQRAHRLRLISDRLSNETEEQRAHRLRLISDRLSNETEEHVHRLGLIHDRLSNETPEARLNRLNTMRQTSHIRRDITNEQSFQTAINVFADVSCDVCKKNIYPQQRFNLRPNMYNTLLPEELIALDKITTCSRCNNHIKKRKIPPTAYWNKMMPAEIPPELANLTSFEERFLCRIVPFLKIMKLNNRFSQNWCKGQVILFAKDVVEIADQLPLTPHQAGLILVVESLEDLSSSKEFVVDTQRLNKALTWLISNNHLYRDVQHILNLRQTLLQDGTEETSSNQYVIINDNKAILRGSFHQGDLRFNSSRGKQCTGIAAVACVAFTVLDPNNWSKSDIDYILIIGDKYYNDCIASRNNPAFGEMNPDYLAVTDLMPSLVYNRQNIAITVLEETNINGHLDNDNSSDGFPNLRNALRSFFTEYSSGILTTNAISVAVHYRTSYYYLFDSHARGAKGSSAPINGAACCMRFTDLDDLHTVLRRNLYVSPNKPSGGNLRDNLNVYSLTPLVVAVDNQMRSFRPISEQSAIEMMESPTFTPSLINLLQPPIQVIESVQKTLQSALAQGSEIQLPITANNSLNTIYIESTSMLQNIDDNVPNLESVVGVNTSLTDDTMRLAAITRKTAPPLNLERERRMEELCWYFIYPDGKNGFGEERENPVTPLDYFQNRIMNSFKQKQRISRNSKPLNHLKNVNKDMKELKQDNIKVKKKCQETENEIPSHEC